MLARRAEPFSVRDDHQRRAKAGGVIATVTGITQKNLQRTKRNINPTRTKRQGHFGAMKAVSIQ